MTWCSSQIAFVTSVVNTDARLETPGDLQLAAVPCGGYGRVSFDWLCQDWQHDRVRLRRPANIKPGGILGALPGHQPNEADTIDFGNSPGKRFREAAVTILHVGQVLRRHVQFDCGVSLRDTPIGKVSENLLEPGTTLFLFALIVFGHNRCSLAESLNDN